MRVWPFSIPDFIGFITPSLVDGHSFIGVASPIWEDGFHPPPTRLFSLKSTPGGTVATVENKASLIRILKKANASPKFAVDLYFYFPNKKVQKSEIAELESCFESFNFDRALRRWGGYWFKLHDGSQALFVAKSNATALRALFFKIMKSSGAWMDQEKLPALFRDIQALKSSKCMVVWWFEWSVIWKPKNLDVLRYEQLEKM